MYKYEHIAKFYDLFSFGTNADKKFYLDESKRCKGKVLEIAVGTGRITLPLLEAGVDIYGLDISEGMLKVLEEKAKKKKIDIKGRIKKSDMRKFKFNQKFDLIIIPYRAFLHNITTEDQAATLNQCYKHLKKGGKLILDFFFPNPFALIKGIKTPYKDADIVVKRKNYSVRLIGYSKHDHTRQQIDAKFIFREKTKGQKMKEYVDEFKLAWIGVNEFKHLAARTGFKIKKLYGGFDKKEKIRLKNGDLIWVLEK
jgi:ubiquinone/menaquinone biosynthesis C-methylase UbiE